MNDSARRIAILTDSTSDIPHDLRQKHDIFVVPQLLVWGQETLRDEHDIDSATFYKRLVTDPVHPRTSQPSVGDFLAMFEKIGQEADEIVAVLISNHLSGSIASAEGAKEMADIPVHIVNSLSVSLGLGAAVMAAVEARDAGGDVAAIVAAAEKRAGNHNLLFVVDTLEYLHKGGRIGGASKLVGTALNIKPVLHLVDGRIESRESVRTRSKSIARMLEIATEGLDTSAPLGGAVLHGNVPEEGAQVAQRYRELYQPQEFMMSEVTPAIGVHAGPGVLGVVSYNL